MIVARPPDPGGTGGYVGGMEAAMGPGGLVPLSEAQVQLQAPALRVVHFLHDAGHAVGDPAEARPGLDRGHLRLLSHTDPLSVRAFSIAVRPPPPDRTNALFPAPAHVLDRQVSRRVPRGPG